MMHHPPFAFSVGLPVAPHAAAGDKEFVPEPSSVRSKRSMHPGIDQCETYGLDLVSGALKEFESPSRYSPYPRDQAPWKVRERLIQTVRARSGSREPMHWKTFIAREALS
jgi:ATP sulfurylase